MSLNRAENGAASQKPARSLPDWSLTTWLTLSNAGSAFLILALIASLLYGGLVVQLESQNQFYLHDEVQMLEQIIRSKGDDASLAATLSPDHTGKEYVKHFIRLMDKNGRIVYETPRMAELAPRAAFHAALRDGRPGVDKSWRSANGELAVGTSEWVDLGKSTGEQGILQVALDVTNVDSILIGYRVKIYGLLFPGFLLCVAVSYAIARKGTSSLVEMTGHVRRITASNLKEHISGSDWPRELNVLARAANQMLDRLDDSFSRVYNSATNLSHKMRTPLTILRGEAELALSRDRTVEELQDVIASSLEENDRLLRLIENILFLSSAEMGKFNTVASQLELRGELDSVVDFYTPFAEEKGIAITCSGSAEVQVDASLFRKAAALISNAIIYNAPGGTVELILRQGEDLSGELSVSDSGCGIIATELPKIFDRFYRIYATRYRDPQGTGLGLPIAKAIMDLHNGAIAVQSQPEQGTTVILKFPAPAD
jgi:two-component system heavy metal sensor histidine kinase CusS